MNVYVIQKQDGSIISLHRTIDGAAHYVLGHGGSPSIKGQDGFTMKTMQDSLTDAARIEITYADGTEGLTIENHGIFV